MISVIIPMYNAGEVVLNAINSVMHQTYQGKIEIILIDDGSTDNSYDIVNNYIKNISNKNIDIKVISQKNMGVASARNRGISQTIGEWIALLDHDDVWLPTKIEKQMKVIKNNPNIKFIGCNVNNDKYPFFGKKNHAIFTLNAKELIIKWYPSTPTILVNRQFILDNGLFFDDNKKYGEDIDWLLRICLHTNLYILNDNLVVIGNGKRPYGDKGLSANLSKMYNGEILTLNGAKERNQINNLEYICFCGYLFLKYIRRIIITKWHKMTK
ncbi:MAG: glycosyltransferase family 2 protein [Campylobacteraceae bacterium]|jgi:glycosyltransferase involved in cell wall biosynthesis|nr:glycosyltransferase family 2 protein [Campylobacteraceae bacterium]